MDDFTSARFGPPGSERQLRQYNFRHFLPKHGLADVWRTLGGRILRPGEPVPPFELETTDGERVSPSHFAGRPMLVHIGNGT
jgi:hypothetical protein